MIDQAAMDALIDKGMQMLRKARELHKEGHVAVAEELSREASWEIGLVMEAWGASFSEAVLAGRWIRRFVEGTDE